MALELACTTEEKIKVIAAPTTPRGLKAPLDGPIVVTVVGGDATVDQSQDDPLSFYLVSGDVPGDTTFLVEADADLGSGVVLIQDTVTLHVAGAMAAIFGLTADAPVPK